MSSLAYAVAGDSQVYLHKPSGSCVLIEKGNFSVLSEVPSVYQQLTFSPIGCLIGLIKLKINSYIIVCDKYDVVGTVLNSEIAQVSSYKILPVQKAVSTAEESEYVSLLKEQLNKNKLYFSVDNKVDLTTNFQAHYSAATASVNEEFWWNKHVSQGLLDNGFLADFVTPIINGYFRSESVLFAGKRSTYGLITRKSVKRSGTRYFRRGIDADGNVANFNETEQFIITDDALMSFVQIRGSVPIYWSEVNNLKYKPNLIISSKNALEPAVKHFSKSVDNYGSVFCINLVNQKGYELPVKEGYESLVNSLPEQLKPFVNYIYFDFHHECKNMQFQNVNKLIDHVEKLGFSSDNYFHYDLASKKVVNHQDKVIRTNCMDCLDRTNVVQSMFSRWILQHQFENLGLIGTKPWAQVDPKFNYIFQNIWADNADAVSYSYSSTPALKTDFTRLGKRTFKGALNDLNNSIVRYYNNNLKDGIRQDSFDLFLGKFKPFESVENPFYDYRPQYVQLIPYLLTTSILILLSLVFYPRGSIASVKNLILISGCLFFQYKSVKFMLKNSYQFVNWPNLERLDFLDKKRVTDSDGKIIGLKYEHNKDFKIQTKKAN